MGLRRKLTDYLLRDQAANLRDATEALWELWEKRPWLARRLGPSMGEGLWETLEEAARVGEIDQHLVDTLRRHARYIRLDAGRMGVPEESERLEFVAESRLLFREDVITQQIVALWTNFGYGQVITIVPEDEKGKEVWDEFWDARRNRPVLKDRRVHRLSDREIVDGELFFVAFVNEDAETEDRPKGAVTLRTIVTEQITEILHDPEDEDVPLFYKREWMPSGENATKTLYYPDWEATEDDLERADLPDGAERADEENDGTGAYVLHAAYREIAGRGWPLQSAGQAWSRAYRDFLQDQTAVAAAVAMYVRKLKVQGGSRATDAMVAKMESSLTRLATWTERNPRAAAGSTFVENEAAELSSLPLGTGARDAAITGASLVGQAGLGGQVFPHWLGRGEAFRLATASAMAQPVLKAFRRYQLWWADVWRDLVDLVLTMKERYGDGEFESHKATVSTDAEVEADIGVMSKALVDLGGVGYVPAKPGMRIALTLLGVPNVEELLDKAFPEEEEAEEVFVSPEARAIVEAAERMIGRT